MLERVLGVIPARGGSKGVHRKNLRSVGGRSLIAWALQTAQESKRLTRVLVTTDDDEIEVESLRLGGTVHRRPAELGTDESPIALTVLDALATAEQGEGCEYDAVVLLQLTSPLRHGSDVDSAIELLERDDEADSVISVCDVGDVHPSRMYRVDGDGRLRPFWPEWERARRQDLPLLYHRNGALYVVRRSTLVDTHEMIGMHPLAYVMPSRWWANIDDERDLRIADVLAREWLNEDFDADRRT